MTPRSRMRTALVLALAAPTAYAQPGALEDLSLEELLNTPVETSSRRVEPLSRVPANALVVTAQQIESRRYVNLKDLLQDLPGVHVYENFSDQVRAQVSVRGVPGTQTFVILQDGRRLTSPTGEALSIEDNYPLLHAKQVEVVFGPASALYGADALSGVINIITAEGEGRAGAKLSAAGGTDLYRRGAFSGHARLLEDKLLLRLTGHLHASDNPDLASAYPEDFRLVPQQNPFTGEAMVPSRTDGFDHRTGSHTLNVEARYADAFTVGYDRRAFAHSSAVGNFAEYVVYGTQSRLDWERVYVEHRAELAPGLSARTQVQNSAVRYRPDFSFNNFFSAYQTVWKAMSNEAFSVQENVSWALTGKQHLTLGGSWANVVSAPPGSDLASQVDPSRPAADQGFTLPGSELPVPFYEVRYQTAGAYVQLQSEWLQGLSTTVGVRFDHDGRFGNTLNPRVGAVYQPVPGHTLKLMYGEAYLAPSTYNQYIFYGAFAGTDAASGLPLSPFFHLPNPELQPMKARTVELNHAALLGSRMMLSTSAYLSRTDNVITPVVKAGREPFAGGLVDVVERFESIGRARQYGGSVQLHAWERLGPVGVEAWASYTLSLGRSDDGPGTLEGALPYNTPHSVKAGTTLTWEQLAFTPRLRWSSGATHASDPARPGERIDVPGAAIVDAALRWADVVGQLSLTLDVRNVLDTRSYAPGNLGLTVFAQNPQDTRRAMLEASYRF